MDAPISAAQLLTEAQRRSGLSPSRWAEEAGVSRALLHSYLRGRHQPSLPQLDRLVRAAGQQLHLEVRPLPRWDDPGEQPPQRRSREEQAQALIDVLSVADAIPVRRRSPLRYPLLRGFAPR